MFRSTRGKFRYSGSGNTGSGDKINKEVPVPVPEYCWLNVVPVYQCIFYPFRFPVDISIELFRSSTKLSSSLTLASVALANQYGPTDEGTAKYLFLLVVTGGGSGKGKKNVVFTVVVVVAVVCALVVVLVVVGYWFLWRWRKIGLARKWNARRLKSNLNSHLDSISGSTTFIRYTFDEIKAATKNLSRLNIVGTGGYGNVYNGVLPGGIEVALRRFKNCSVVV
ncbi:hypothetical protein FXO38_05166 [Capsicum annuum]|nr:hypothetical protein FXO38_05166 [Capsicum annuum]KAF3677202.1 hypothetical protein FXO37_04945 [Capsicum annuum]